MTKSLYIYFFISVMAIVLPSRAFSEALLDDDDKPKLVRLDREIPETTFIEKGETILGLTASYRTMASDNSTLLYMVTDLDASLYSSSINPFIGYFYRDNRCVGLRFGYSRVGGSVDGGVLDLGESNDMSFEIPTVGMSSSSFDYAIFHRSYLSLDKRGSFGLFAEFELQASDGESFISYDISGTSQKIKSDNFAVDLGFNPGIVVFVLDNVSTNVSIGLGGLGYKHVKQYDEGGAISGSRQTSKLSLKLNVTDINFGVTIHL